MTKNSIFYSICLVMVLLSSCKKDSGPVLQELDLMSYQMPIVIQAPEGATIKKMDLLVQKDITVRKGSEYFIQIFETDATERNLGKIKDRMLTEVKENPHFAEIILEEDRGFIYKTQIDSTLENYGFRYAHVQADKEYTFQTGLSGIFTKDQVEHMYKAVKN